MEPEASVARLGARIRAERLKALVPHQVSVIDSRRELGEGRIVVTVEDPHILSGSDEAVMLECR
jgi:hypothetical protein